MSLQIDLSIFDVLNIYRSRWFLSRANLLLHVTAAQKAVDGKISWVEFDPPFHSHLVKCAHALVPRPTPAAKKSMFVFILEVLNGEVPKTFFDLPPAAKSKGERRLTRQKRLLRGVTVTLTPLIRPEADGGKKRVVGAAQEPRPTSVALDRGSFPRLHGAPVTRPSPPVDTPPSPSPLLSLILNAPRHSHLYPVADNPSYDEWEIPESQEARRQLWSRLRDSIGELRIRDWEVVDDSQFDHVDEMEVEEQLGAAPHHVPSPSPPPPLRPGPDSPGGAYYHWLDTSPDSPFNQPFVPPSQGQPHAPPPLPSSPDTSSQFDPPPALYRLPDGS
jgi:hypothetical protein